MVFILFCFRCFCVLSVWFSLLLPLGKYFRNLLILISSLALACIRSFHLFRFCCYKVILLLHIHFTRSIQFRSLIIVAFYCTLFLLYYLLISSFQESKYSKLTIESGSIVTHCIQNMKNNYWIGSLFIYIVCANRMVHKWLECET